jgi:hypothetical protein
MAKTKVIVFVEAITTSDVKGITFQLDKDTSPEDIEVYACPIIGEPMRLTAQRLEPDPDDTHVINILNNTFPETPTPSQNYILPVAPVL